MEFRNQSALYETEEPEPEPINRTMRFLKLIEGLRVTEYGIRLSVGSDCNEQRAAAAGQKITSLHHFLLSEDSHILSECFFFHDSFSDRNKSSVVKQANIFMISCPVFAARYWIQKFFEHLADSFSSVQIPQLFSNP